MTKIFVTPDQRRAWLGKSRKRWRKRRRRMIDTYDWISRVRWHASARRDEEAPATLTSAAIGAVLFALLVALAWASLR